MRKRRFYFKKNFFSDYPFRLFSLRWGIFLRRGCGFFYRVRKTGTRGRGILRLEKIRHRPSDWGGQKFGNLLLLFRSQGERKRRQIRRSARRIREQKYPENLRNRSRYDEKIWSRRWRGLYRDFFFLIRNSESFSSSYILPLFQTAFFWSPKTYSNMCSQFELDRITFFQNFFFVKKRKSKKK